MQLQAAEEGVPHLTVAQGANQHLSLFDLCASSGNKKVILLFSFLFFFFCHKGNEWEKKNSLVTSSLYIVELQKIRVLNLIQF